MWKRATLHNCGQRIQCKTRCRNRQPQGQSEAVTVKRYLDKMVSKSGELMLWNPAETILVMFKEKMISFS